MVWVKIITLVRSVGGYHLEATKRAAPSVDVKALFFSYHPTILSFSTMNGGSLPSKCENVEIGGKKVVECFELKQNINVAIY